MNDREIKFLTQNSSVSRIIPNFSSLEQLIPVGMKKYELESGSLSNRTALWRFQTVKIPTQRKNEKCVQQLVHQKQKALKLHLESGSQVNGYREL